MLKEIEKFSMDYEFQVFTEFKKYYCDCKTIRSAFESGFIKARDMAAEICNKTWVQPGDLQVENCHEAAELIMSMGESEVTEKMINA